VQTDAGCSPDEPVLISGRQGDLYGGSPSNPACGCYADNNCLSGACVGGQCAICDKDSNCPNGLACETNASAPNPNTCVQCTKDSNCPTGEVCDVTETNATFNTANLLWAGSDTCVPDCHSDAGTCIGFCSDGGVCYNPDPSGNPYQGACAEPTYWYTVALQFTVWCMQDSDCKVDGGGACYYTTDQQWPFYYVNESLGETFSNGFGYCVECTLDGGGCASNDQICQPVICPGYVTNGLAGSCANCFLDGGACPEGFYCSDAGTAPSGVAAGFCVGGCLDDSSCAGNTPRCVDGGCVECGTNSDCPDWKPGCSSSNTCGGACNPTSVGSCRSSEKCDQSQCNTDECVCYSDSDCPLDVPICIGLNADAGTSGNCGCTDSTQCTSGYLCDTRPPYNVTNGCGQAVAGACIPACATNADCSAFAGVLPAWQSNLWNLTCDVATGYCVPCAGNQDCAADVNSICSLYVDGGNPNSNPMIVTGGGQCGCAQISDCQGGYTCYQGQCQPPCIYDADSGYDSCFQGAQFYSHQNPDFCNTFTGLCVQCLDDYDCEGFNYGHRCVAGACVPCVTSDDCTWPNAVCSNNKCTTNCTDDSQCPTDGGYTCFALSPGSQPMCNIQCLAGDDAGLGTVADGGTPCPGSQPLCTTESASGATFTLDAGLGICNQCNNVTQTWCNDEATNDCVNHCGLGGTRCSTGVGGCSWYCSGC
jgi:Cys-rich repeat protein